MTEPNLTYKTVWRLDDPSTKSDAISLWRSLNILPPGTEDSRASSLCIVAYDDDKLAAVSTVGIEYSSSVKAKVAWFRCLVGENYRQCGVATELAYRCRVYMEEWARDNPREGVMAFGTLVENPYLKHLSGKPVWPRTGMTLIGHDSFGRQIRLVWFDHAVVET